MDRKSGLTRQPRPQGRLAEASVEVLKSSHPEGDHMFISAEEGGPCEGWVGPTPFQSRPGSGYMPRLAPVAGTFLGFGAALTPVTLLTRKVKLQMGSCSQ